VATRLFSRPSRSKRPATVQPLKLLLLRQSFTCKQEQLTCERQIAAVGSTSCVNPAHAKKKCQAFLGLKKINRNFQKKGRSSELRASCSKINRTVEHCHATKHLGQRAVNLEKQGAKSKTFG